MTHRSPESIARRRETSRRLWRERGAQYRAHATPRSRAVVLPEIPPLHTGHPLFDQARRIAGIERDERIGTVARATDLLREDGLSVAVLAILERRDAAAAYKAFRTQELDWMNRTTFLPDDED